MCPRLINARCVKSADAALTRIKLPVETKETAEIFKAVAEMVASTAGFPKTAAPVLVPNLIMSIEPHSMKRKYEDDEDGDAEAEVLQPLSDRE